MTRLKKRSSAEKVCMILYILTILASVMFLNPRNIITPQLSKGCFYALILGGFIYTSIKHRRNISKYPKLLTFGVIGGICTSIFMGYTFHNQSFSTTLIATLPSLCGYLSFPLFLRYSISKEKIIRILFILTLISGFVYIVNAITFPKTFFFQEKEEWDMSRGIVRLGITFIEVFVLLLFYCLNQWQISGKRKWLLWTLYLSVFIVLSVTRQIILMSAILGILFLLHNASWSKKIATVIIISLFYFLILPEIPIYKTMVELSEAQKERNDYQEEDIRIQAWKFYTTEYQTNSLTPIFGNGIPALGKSKWAKNFEQTVFIDYGGNGCYGVDVGWAGYFWNFGAISTFSLLGLLLVALKKKKRKNEKYLNYWIVFIIITSCASGPILFHYQIIFISTVLYLVYGKERKSYRSNNPQLQQQ